MGGGGVGRWVVVEGGQPEAGYTFHKDTGSSTVSSLSNRNKHTIQNIGRDGC